MKLSKKFKKYYKKYGSLNLFIFTIILLLGFSIFYYFYFRQRSARVVYIQTIATVYEKSVQSGTFDWVPYWIADSINEGDQEISPLGGINLEVMEKEEYPAWSNGRFVRLVLKINAIKDRSGIYLYKNMPLASGKEIDLNFPNVQLFALITKISDKPITYPKEKLTIVLQEHQVEKRIADALRVGSELKNGKDETVAKILDKKVTQSIPIGMSYESRSGKFVYSNDNDRKDVELTVELLAEKIAGEYYFMKTRKIKTNETLFLAFPEINIDFPIKSFRTQNN